MLVKEKLHKIIDSIEDENILKGYLKLFSSLNESEVGKLYQSLTEAQKNELNISYEESLDPTNLISHEEVKRSHQKRMR